MNNNIRVLIADDNAIVRAGLRLVLDSLDGLELVGEASDGKEAVELSNQLRPDIALLDVRMPRMNGIEAVTVISKTCPAVMLTHSEDYEIIQQSISAGARGYVMYEELNASTLDSSIRLVLQGGLLLSASAANALMKTITEIPDTSNTSISIRGGTSPFGLSNREQEIITLASRGQKNKEIADTLFLSEKTVKNHINRIFSKMNVATRAEAVSVWLRSVELR